MFSRFTKIFSFICVGVAMSLLYVAGHVETIKLSYEIRSKERNLAEAYDTMKNLKYHLASLKSPSQLEHRMIETDLELIPVQNVRVLRFAKRTLPKVETAGVRPEGPMRAHFLTVKEAQAETSG